MENLTLRQLRDKIAAGEIKSAAAVEKIFDSIDKYDKEVQAFITTFKEQALRKARQVDEKIARGEKVGSLAGVPVSIKDNMCYEMGETTCASNILKNFKAPYNATAVQKLIDEDAVIVGKCNLDEFAMGSSTENSGLKKTRNPWDTQKVPGGSSGGSAASVAAQMCMGSLGSDTGGSIRQPASFCGVVGLKPTYGRVSRYGLVAYGSSLDQIGPLTRNIEDTALLLNVISGHDPADSTSVSEEMAGTENYLENLETPVEGLRIGVVERFYDGASDEVVAKTKQAVETYKKGGAEIVDIEMPYFDYSVAAYYVIATAEASSNLARYDGVHYGHRTLNPKDYVEVYSKSRAEGFGQEVKRRIMLGTYALSSGYYDAYYLKALKVRNLIRQDFNNAFEKCDCIMMPVSPTTAFGIGEKTDDPLQMYLSDIYTISVNLAGVPGISIPCGFDSEKMPIGLQIIGPAFGEAKLLRIARMYEKQTEWTNIRAKILK